MVGRSPNELKKEEPYDWKKRIGYKSILERAREWKEEERIKNYSADELKAYKDALYREKVAELNKNVTYDENDYFTAD